MTTLTDFLLVRIAEDEAVARRAQRAYQHVFGIPHYFTANSDTSVAMNPRVALAECEAKRRIVEMSWHHLGDDDYAWGMEEAKRQILVLMAVPYADHPDYRDEWRP